MCNVEIMRKKLEKLVPGKNNTTKRIHELTLKQKRFVEAYLGKANGNATEAAHLAGYEGNRKTLTVIATQNLKKPNIRLAIDEHSRHDGSVATREERQTFLTRIMRTEHRKMNERLKAVELLCRMAGDFIEKHTVDMTVSRKEQRSEIEGFLNQISARADGKTMEGIGPGNPVVKVIDTTAEALAEVENECAE